MEDKKFCVYKHTSPSGKVYIGITGLKPQYRWRKGKGYVHNYYFNNAINKYGWGNIEHEILFDNLTMNEAFNKEIEMIRFYDSTNRDCGYNILQGGQSPPPLTKEGRAKLSESAKKQWENVDYRKKMILANKGNKHWQGKKHTQEYKQHMSKIMSGRIVSKETCNKISKSKKGKYQGTNNPFYGKKHTEEVKRKISEANTGNKYWQGKCHTEETKRKISKSNTGRKQSQSSKEKKSIASKKMWQNPNFNAKMRKIRKGTNLGKDNPMAKKCICLNTSEVFDCMKDASKKYGCYSGIARCCKGESKSAGKHPITGEPLKWMYYEDFLNNAH